MYVCALHLTRSNDFHIEYLKSLEHNFFEKEHNFLRFFRAFLSTFDLKFLSTDFSDSINVNQNVFKNVFVSLTVLLSIVVEPSEVGRRTS